ncbi:MAG: leucine-rich repeat protein [Oscillospiraceae bacterium]|nr:leucine-rich repeat protein [Oscillospiraceae bacterium]
MHSKIRRLTAALCSLALLFTLGTAALADEGSDGAETQETAAAAESADTGAATDTAPAETGDNPESAVPAEDSAAENAADSTESESETAEPTPGNSGDTGVTEDGTDADPEGDAAEESEEDTESESEAETEPDPDAETEGETTEADETEESTQDDAAEDSGSTASSSSTASSASSSSAARYAVSAPEGDTHELYLTQLSSNTCTLASAAMLMRNYIYLNGSDLWQEFGEADIRSAAWNDGLRETFTYSYGDYTFSVARASLSSPSADELKALLDKHPEGIVLYCGNAPHAVLLLDYEEDTFYCADPANLCSGMRIALEDSWLGSYYQGQDAILRNVTHYWYITSAVSPLEDSGLSWAWDGGTLTISGTGTLADDGAIGTAPWDRYRDYVTEIVIEEGIVNVPSYAFYNYANLTAVSLPESLETIGTRAFYGCGSLAALDIPEGVHEIGQYAFAQCTGLEALTIPAGVTVIQKGLCYCCASLTSLTIQEGAETLEASIIYGTALTEITLPASVTAVAAKAFQSCESLTTLYYTGEDTLALLAEAVFSGSVTFRSADELAEAQEPETGEETGATDEMDIAEDETLL